GHYDVVAQASWSGGVYVARGSLDVAKKNALKVDYKVYNVAPGSTAVLVLNITNLGPDDVKNLRVSFTPSQVFELHASNIADVATAGVRMLGDLAPGASVSTAFLLDVSDKAVPGIYAITLVATWNQTGVFMPSVQYINIPIEVKSGIDMFVVIPLVLTILLIVVGLVTVARRRRRG
ncbi:MAG: NEW3 domain-containing protein, partial [Pyrobaculum sp.]